jgi:radical SAM protein with 4Fe4S-binding SPASM domain
LVSIEDIRLGNLLETPFERNWRSPERQRVAQAIHAAPVDCESCAACSGCFGGCRGLAYLASESADQGKPVSKEAASSSSKAK